MLIDQRWPRSVTLRDLGVELTLGTGEFWPHFSICSTRTPPRLGPALWGCPLPPGLVLGVASSGGGGQSGGGGACGRQGLSGQAWAGVAGDVTGGGIFSWALSKQERPELGWGVTQTPGSGC